ncbi:GNAT family N-acetyltransferase [Komagataeibacter europaeus]|uniref:GNAT family N-acetyltransferase n=1 Tax=Komagataeibacter europaeus TaxID=33995 RepID=UPI0018DEEEA7|nr:GNAT family N-acetyltransferase [Komagataeibacter europaeus]
MIETERLRLSLHQPTDFDDLHAMWSDPDVVRHISGVLSSEQESWFRFLRYRGLWDILGYGYWCVRTKADGRYVGDVGFADLKRPVEPPLGAVPEAGWVLARWAHGQGFATEALRAALAWTDGRARRGPHGLHHGAGKWGIPQGGREMRIFPEGQSPLRGAADIAFTA